MWRYISSDNNILNETNVYKLVHTLPLENKK